MTVCKTCNNETLPGKWCSVCRANLINPNAGSLASPLRRLGAFLLDELIFVVLIVLMIMLMAGKSMTGIVLLSFLLWGGAQIYLLFKGTTIGKRLLKMWVVKEDGSSAGFLRMLIRELLGKPLISGFFFGLGYLWIILDKERQGWHDKFVSTYVVERG